MNMTSSPARSHAEPLLDWYDRHRRAMPWRAPAGQRTDPYRVWLSEIMLQQTTVATVGDYFRRFVDRWPTVEALAAAPLDEILSAWAGLGYYARARNLHACARAVTTQYRGRFPEDEAELLTLPGIGPYTAAAIRAIAFDHSASAVDGNVERVVARLFAVETPLPTAKPELHDRAAQLVPKRRSGDYAQAMMDLGATVCTPRAPHCVICPLMSNCTGRAAQHRRKPAAARTQGRQADAAGRGLRADAARRRDPAAQAAAQGPARRHGRGALERMAPRPARPRTGARRGAGPGTLDDARGVGAPHLHAFPSGGSAWPWRCRRRRASASSCRTARGAISIVSTNAPCPP